MEAKPNNMILIVDDDAAIRKLIHHRLKHVGYRVIEATDGRQAMGIIENHPIELVLLDIMMPGTDGIEVLENLRKRRSMDALPIIMLTAKDKGQDVIQAFRSGANDYLTKPLDFSLLLKRIGVQLDWRGKRDKEVSGYRVDSKIGAGAMGVVFAATHVAKRQRVALKLLPRAMTMDEAFVKRFMAEARLASQLDHPNLVEVLDAGKYDDTYFIAMELVEGKNLAELCEDRPMDTTRALLISKQVAEGLEALRDAGIFHRDIKPENVIVAKDDMVKITDFGIAREVAAHQRMTETGVGVGSVVYASPEQIRGGGDFRSDIYSLGATLFFMVTGKDPFPHDKPLEQVLAMKMAQPPTLPPYPQHISKHIKSLVAKMLQPRMERRFQGFGELLASIQAILDGKPRLVRDTHRFVWPLLLAVLAVGVALLVWRLFLYG